MKKYLSVLSDMENRIREGQYSPGQKLPSVRSSAEFYGCSISTILRAYGELERQHAIYSIPQSGYYMVERSEDAGPARGSETIDFASASPDLNVFPYLDFQHCLNKAIDRHKYHLFTYGDTLGLGTLRQTLVPHLAEYQVFAKVGQIIITSGTQQALEVLAKMPFPNGGTEILVEQPGYDLYLRYLEAEGMPVSGIARSAAGIDLRELEERFSGGESNSFIPCPDIIIRSEPLSVRRNGKPLPGWPANTMCTSLRMIIWQTWVQSGALILFMRMTRLHMLFI